MSTMLVQAKQSIRALYPACQVSVARADLHYRRNPAMTEIFEHKPGPIYSWSDVPPKQPEPKKQSPGLTPEERDYILSYTPESQSAIRGVIENSEICLRRPLEPERVGITESWQAVLTRADGTVEIRSG